MNLTTAYDNFLKNNDTKQTLILGDFIEKREISSANGPGNRTCFSYQIQLNPEEVLGEVFLPNIPETNIIDISIEVGGILSKNRIKKSMSIICWI